MARKCSSCGIPAPDEESKFCNRCGGAIADVPEPQFPVCGTCGAQVADPEAQFCDKCGGPVKKSVVCPTCGNPALDENSKFCTRCGTTFVRPNTCPACGFVNPDEKAAFCNRCGAPLKGSVTPAAPAPVPAPPAAPPRKRPSLPIQDEPVPDWDPWSDGAPAEYAEPPYASPSPADPEPAYRAPQVRMPSKKYSHLPLVADEMKDYKRPPSDPDNIPEGGRKERPPLKKSPLNFMKR